MTASQFPHHTLDANCKLQIANRKFPPGFTLIELLTVVAIIAILASIVIGVSGYASRKADISKAKADMEKIKSGLEEYRIAYGVYPVNATEDDSTAISKALWVDPQADSRISRPLLVMKGWVTASESYEILDPWQNDYRYIHRKNEPPQTSPPDDDYYADHNNSRFGYDLWSAGPDGLDDTEDDINNWSADK